jgi:hypothetical protein
MEESDKRTKGFKIRFTENEYTFIEDLLGNESLSIQIRDLFINEDAFIYKAMPVFNHHLHREVAKIDNNINQLSRAFNLNLNSHNIKETEEAINLLATISIHKKEIDDAFSIIKEESQEEFKFESKGKRTIEAKVYFSDAEYEIAKAKADGMGLPLAQALRENYIANADRKRNAIPKVPAILINRLNKIGIALNYIAKAVNERKKAKVSLLLSDVNYLLSIVLEKITELNNNKESL